MNKRNKIVRFLKWSGVVLAVTAVFILTYAFFPINEDLSGLIPPEGKYEVTIMRDTWGVPHIFGQTNAATAYGLGYAHAEDDFLTIQQTLVAAKGMLGEVYGPDSAPVDYVLGLLRIRERVDAQYETIPADVRAVVEGYADGLNHYAALHQDEVLAPGLFPVTGKDVVAGFAQRTPLFFGLDGVLQELFAEERQRDVSPADAQTLEDGRTAQPFCADTPFFPCRFTAEQPPVTTIGSNTFAVSPIRSANGETFLAINSHQPWEGPVAWYEAHVNSSEGWEAYGGLFPGSPVILHGFNRNLGWAFTVNSPDLVDVYVLDINPDNPNQYWFDGEWRDLEVWDVPLKVKLLGRLTWTVKEEALWSVYGPTVRRPHGTYAIRYVGMDELGYVEQWLRLNQAQSLEEWQAAMAQGAIPMFNAGYADKEGNIAYVYNGRLPIRQEGYDWTLYLPGNTSDTLWQEFLPFSDLPQVINPPSGFIQNANSSPFQTTLGPGNPDPADFSATFGIETHMTNRSLRLRELFAADEAVTFEAFTQYKFDMAYSPQSDVPQWVDSLVNAELPDDANLQQAVDILQAWDLQADPDSLGATIFMLTLNEIHRNELGDFPVSRFVGQTWETAVLVEGLKLAVADLMANYGRVDVPWGEVNRLRRGDEDLPVGGGPDIIHAVYGELGDDGRIRGTAGDGLVILVQWDETGQVRAQSIHQYGSATLRQASPHYADQAPLFAARQMRPVWLDEADIRANLEQSYRPGEE